MNIFLFVTASLLMVIATPTAAGQTVSAEGSWEGTLSVQGQSLTIVFHLTRDADGGLVGTMDSPDQGATGIPVTDVIEADNEITISVAAAAGSFQGELAESRNVIDGEWSQGGRTWPLMLSRTEAATGEAAETPPPANLSVDVTGSWVGTLKAGTAELRVVFHINDAADGGLTGTMDSPDQGATGIPLGSVSGKDHMLQINVPAVGGVYEGEVQPGTNVINGTWSQGGRSFPLNLEVVGDQGLLQPERPQEPKAPFPYRLEDVQFHGPGDAPMIAGTLSLPAEAGQYPGAVMISGSGPQNRDEEVYGHKPFLVIADYLTRNGIAVLRYDDRGVGESEGDFSTATIKTFAEDAMAAFSYLSSRPEVDSKRTGLIGHSEGGLTAVVAGSGPSGVEPSFLILLATPGVTGEEILYEQMRALAVASGASEQDVEAALQQQRHIYSILTSNQNQSQIRSRLRDYLQNDNPATANATEKAIETQVGILTSSWFQRLLTYDPAPDLSTIKCPVLALTGSKDLQVPPHKSLSHIEKAVRSGGNEDVTVVELPKLNHLFQTADSGLPSEYARIRETVAPLLLETIANWIGQIAEG